METGIKIFQMMTRETGFNKKTLLNMGLFVGAPDLFKPDDDFIKDLEETDIGRKLLQHIRLATSRNPPIKTRSKEYFVKILTDILEVVYFLMKTNPSFTFEMDSSIGASSIAIYTKNVTNYLFSRTPQPFRGVKSVQNLLSITSDKVSMSMSTYRRLMEENICVLSELSIDETGRMNLDLSTMLFQVDSTRIYDTHRSAEVYLRNKKDSGIFVSYSV